MGEGVVHRGLPWGTRQSRQDRGPGGAVAADAKTCISGWAGGRYCAPTRPTLSDRGGATAQERSDRW